MAVYTISLDGAAELGAFAFIADLDGTDYRLRFQLNSREGFWYFDLLDLDGNQLRSGIKVVSNYPMLRLFMAIARPRGELLSIDTRPEPTDPGREALNVTSVFAYMDIAEIEAL